MNTSSPYRFGGWSGVLGGILSLGATFLVFMFGPPSMDAEELLRFLSPLTTSWALMVTLGVAADLLLLPFAYALYRALRGSGANLALAGCGLLAIFAIVDLAVRWPTWAGLVTLAGPWSDATTTEIEALTISAGHATATMGSFLWPIYFTLIPGVGVLLASISWQRSELGRLVAYAGIAVGLLAIASVLAGTATSLPAALMIVTSAAMAIWLALAGYALTRLDPA